VIYLLDGDVAELRRDGVRVTCLDGAQRARPVDTVEWDAEAAEKGGYEHYMLKEIYEQPTVLQNTLGGRLARSGTDVELDLGLDPRSVERDRKSTRLNSSHVKISYAVFCLKKKK